MGSSFLAYHVSGDVSWKPDISEHPASSSTNHKTFSLGTNWDVGSFSYCRNFSARFSNECGASVYLEGKRKKEEDKT